MSRVAVVGATGAVGREIIRCLETRNFPLQSLKPLASKRSAGRRLQVGGTMKQIEVLDHSSFRGVDLALFASSGDNARRFAPLAAEAGAAVIDNSSAFRLEPGVPLVVPEINGTEALVDNESGKGTIVANPNCSTILLAMALWPIHTAFGVKRAVVSTYQAASGAGVGGMNELTQQAADWVSHSPLQTPVFGRQYLWNVFSHNSTIQENGYNEEENKIMNEMKKIFACEIPIAATCVRVPVLRAHCESVNVSLTSPATEHEFRELLRSSPGVTVVDDREANKFPEPLDASEQDQVLVGRIRQDPTQPRHQGYELFLSGDQLLKGAALNAVQIAELFV